MNTTYYITKDDHGLLELRQTRFAALFKSGMEHPHDICAIARNEDEMRRMVETCKLGSVDWTGATETLSA